MRRTRAMNIDHKAKREESSNEEAISSMKKVKVDLNCFMNEIKTENCELKRSLEIKEAEAEKNGEVINKLKNKIMCPGCLLIPRTPQVFDCPNGHIVCSNCKGEFCPLCNGLMGSGKCVLAETLIESIQHKCKHASCEEMFDLDAVEAHEKICTNRLVACPKVRCNEEVPLSKLLDHLVEGTCFQGDKPIVKKQLERIQLKLKDDRIETKTRQVFWPLKLYEVEDTNFVVIPQRVDYFYCFPVVLLGSKEDCSKYKVVVEVFGKNASTSGTGIIKIERKPCSIDVNKEDMKHACRVVNKVDFEEVLNEENEFRYSVTICKNLDE